MSEHSPREVTIERLLRDVQRIPPIVGHPWNELMSGSRAELSAVLQMLKADATAIHSQIASKERAWGSMGWRRDAGLALAVKNRQIAALKLLINTNWQQPEEIARKERRMDRRALHLARMFHQWMECDTDAAWGELMDAYHAMPSEMLDFSRREPLI